MIVGIGYYVYFVFDGGDFLFWGGLLMVYFEERYVGWLWCFGSCLRWGSEVGDGELMVLVLRCEEMVDCVLVVGGLVCDGRSEVVSFW